MKEGKADMWGRHDKFVRLNEELGSISALDRLHEYATDSNRDHGTYLIRQARQSEILAEITKLKAQQPLFEAHARVLSVALLLCVATAYATLHFLVR